MTLDEETITQSLKLDALKRFLKLRNWRLMEYSNDTTLMYEGPLDELTGEKPVLQHWDKTCLF